MKISLPTLSNPGATADPGAPADPFFVVGVDGGGTGSRAMILDQDGMELGRAQGPPALIDPSDPTPAADAIAQTVRAAVDEAGVTLPARNLWAGLAGAGRAGCREAVEISLRSMELAEKVRVGMDVEGAHRDAFGPGPGLLLVVGTGSMAWGRDSDGLVLRVGGWGEYLGDEGSGYSIGLQGLRAVARADDLREEATSLTGKLLDAVGFEDPAALIPWVVGVGKGEIAALAPLVLEAADEEDKVAVRIVEAALEEIRLHLSVAASRWGSPERPIPMAMVGGLVEGEGGLGERIRPLMKEVGGELCPHPVLPVRGAARLALALS